MVAVETVLRLVEIDARRPASWLALGASAGAVAALDAPAWPTTVVLPLCVAAGGFAAVAAVGDTPQADAPTPRWFGPVWCSERAAWPVAGLLLAGGWRLATTGGGFGAAVAMLVGVAAATAIVSAARGHFASGADAVSLAITLVVAAAVGGSAAAEAGLGDPLAWSIVCLAAGAALAWAVCRHASGPTLVSGRNAVEAAPASFTGMVLAGGRLRTALTRLAMVTSLAGMVAWFFLAPEHARRYGLLAAAWFSCLAVPRGLLDPGGGADAWGRLARTAAVTAAGMTAAQRLRRPDLLGWANAAAVAHAAILGWPAVVAAALWLAGTGGGVPWPVITLAGLAGAAALLVALAALVESDSISRDTGHALASVAVIAILAGWLLLPGLRGVPKAPGQTDVEKIAPLER